MGLYSAGDVVLVAIPIGSHEERKVRPAVVVSAGEDGRLAVLPISSRAASDTPSIPISLDDFSRGGLDLFGTSYVLLHHASTVRSSEIVGRKGRLAFDALARITEGIQKEQR